MKNDRLTVNCDGRPCYDIIFSDGFAGLADALSGLGFEGRRIAVITESNVAPLYLAPLMEELNKLSGEHYSHVFPAGEENKHLDTVGDIYSFLIERRFDRHDLLIALGGGVTGDITGFAAASYLRGVSFVQVPTTLLSQCDSAIGGKTGVDYRGYKNMVGAFYMPILVWMNLSTLLSLDKRQFISGFAEVIKHGFIKDRDYFESLISNRQGILNREVPVLMPMIRRSSEIKKQVVENDPREKGERALLNFGHTIGHAIEKYSGFSLYHGECVSLGMCAAAEISVRRGLMSAEEGDDLKDSLSSFGLPVKYEGELEAGEILKLVKSDKKMDNGRIRFILLNSIGNAVICPDVTDDDIMFGIKSVI